MKPINFRLTVAALAALAVAGVGDDARADRPEDEPDPKPRCTGQQTPAENDCISLRPDGLGPRQLYEHGAHFALNGDYDRALLFLERADPSDPRVLNYTGYTIRQMGDVEGGLVYYAKALAIDPTFILARSYRGEGFLTLGMRNAAQADLTAIANIAGTDNPPYQRLANAIASYDNGTFRSRSY